MTSNAAPSQSSEDAGLNGPYSHALPFVISVCGHRNLNASQLEHVKREFSAVLEIVLAALPNTPVLVLSALADGADRAFAEAALELREKLGRSVGPAKAQRLTLAAPLPMALPDFLGTFGVPASAAEPMTSARARSIAEFEDLRARLAATFGGAFSAYEIAPPSLDNALKDRIREQQQRMMASGAPAAECDAVAAYAAHSRYLILHAHLVVAAWDGESREPLCGGTADVVDACRKGFDRVCDERSARRFYESERGPVVHIKVVRGPESQSLDARPAGGRVHLLEPCDAGPELLQPMPMPSLGQWLGKPFASTADWLDHRQTLRMLSRRPPLAGNDITANEQQRICLAVWSCGREMELINREHARHLAMDGDSYVTELRNAAGYLLKSLPASAGAGGHETGVMRVVARFSMADVLAAKLQRTWRTRWKAIAAGTLIAGLASIAKLLVPAHPDLAESFAFMAGALIAIVTYMWVTLSPLRNAYLDCRAMAEGLRFQLYWLVAGKATLVTNHYVLKWRKDLGWVRQALDGACAVPTVKPLDAWEVCKKWISDQLDYLDFKKTDSGRTMKRRQKQDESINAWSGRLLLAGIALGGLALMAGAGLFGNVDGRTLSWIVAAMKTAPAIGAALLAFNGKVANSESVKQAEHMVGIYERAAAELSAISRQTSDAGAREARDLMEALGKEALAENASWLMMHRQRKLSWHGK